MLSKCRRYHMSRRAKDFYFVYNTGEITALWA